MFGYEWTKSFWVRPDHLITRLFDCESAWYDFSWFLPDWLVHVLIFVYGIYNVIRTDEHPHLYSLGKICRNLKLMTWSLPKKCWCQSKIESLQYSFVFLWNRCFKYTLLWSQIIYISSLFFRTSSNVIAKDSWCITKS